MYAHSLISEIIVRDIRHSNSHIHIQKHPKTTTFRPPPTPQIITHPPVPSHVQMKTYVVTAIAVLFMSISTNAFKPSTILRR
jgi:hypothetical protein